MTMSVFANRCCILCGDKAPVQWRWRRVEHLQTYSRKHCKPGPFVWKTLMECGEDEVLCCLGCVFQMRKRVRHPNSAKGAHMWPMDGYLLWLLTMDHKPDMRQVARLRGVDSVYYAMAGAPLVHIRDEQTWLAFNANTQFFANARVASCFRREPRHFYRVHMP